MSDVTMNQGLWGSITRSWSLACYVAVGRWRSCRLLVLVD